MRPIDADALNMAFTMLRFNEDGTLRHWGDRQNWCLSGQEVEDLINSIPTIEPERKTGQWVHDGKEHKAGTDWMHCSECGYKTVWSGACMTPYCPWCGARMEEQDE